MEKDTLRDDREDFELCLDAERDQRKVSQDDLEFALLDKQWDERDVSQRKEEGRPCLTINKLKAFGNQVVNDGILNPAVVNVKPVGDGADKETADIQSDLIRNIETQSQAASVYETAFRFAVYGGLGYFRVNVDYTCEDAWDQDIMLERISNPFSVYGDYEGKEATSIDWNRAYVTDWYPKAAFERRWGKDRKASSFEDGSNDYDQNWFEDKRIRVAERWLREEVAVKLLKLSSGAIMYEREYLKNQELFDRQGVFVEGDRETKGYKVTQRLITGTDILEENEWLGKYIPIIPMYGEEININGKRHFVSLIHRAKDAQRMFNYWRTASTELVALAPKAPYVGAVGQFVTDAAKWQTANRTTHAYIEYDVVDGIATPPQRQPFAGVPAGALQEALNASDDMKAIIGMYDASLGARSNETSGKAINARKQEGDVSTYGFINNKNNAIEHGGRVVLDLIPKVYTAERILRCVQEDGTTYIVPVNQPVAKPQDIAKLRQSLMMGPMPMGQQGMQQEGPQDGPPEYTPIPPDLSEQVPAEQLQAISRIFDLTTGKYDVLVTAGPSFSTRREESATQMMEFIRVFPQAAPLIGDLLAKTLDWPGSEQIAERLKAMLPPQAQGQVNPMVQQLQQMLQQRDGQAKQAIAQLQQQIAQLGQQVQDKRQEIAIKGQELQVKQFEAETRRAEAMKQEAPQAPDPFKAVEIELSQREIVIKEYEAETDRLKVLIDAGINPMTGELLAQTVVQASDTPIDGVPPVEPEPGPDLPSLIAQAVAQAMPPRGLRRARAVRQPDGSIMMEDVEDPPPIEPAPMPDDLPPEAP